MLYGTNSTVSADGQTNGINFIIFICPSLDLIARIRLPVLHRCVCLSVMRSRLLVDRERYQYHTTTCRHQEDTERMGPPLVDAVSSRSREAAVETVIDMDPNGAAHRMARTKVGTAICGILMGCG